MRESSRDTTAELPQTMRKLGRAAASARFLARTTSSVASLTLSRGSSSSLVLSIQDGIFANAHYHGTPRFLLGMQVLLLLSRPLVIMLWCKMWDLGFGAADAANPYGQMEDAMPAPPPRGAPRGRRRRVQALRRARREPLARAGRRRVRASRRGAAMRRTFRLSDDDVRAESATDEIASDRRASGEDARRRFVS